MEDFAAGAMIRLIRAGLSAQGLPFPGLPFPGLPDDQNAHVPFQDKRNVMRALMADHGPVAILKIADAIQAVPPAPVTTALTLAADVPDLMNRWARLERFSHSRHRMQQDFEKPGVLHLRHRPISGNALPEVGETLVVTGLIAKLVERIAPSGFSLTLRETAQVLRSAGTWSERFECPPPPFEFTLKFDPSEGPTPRREWPEGPADDLSVRVRALYRSDAARAWRLKDLSRELALSSRNLQRRLAEQGTSASKLLSDARMDHASTLLSTKPNCGLAEIGFLCGFTDQAHFSRRFKKATGTTPGAYRQDFSV